MSGFIYPIVISSTWGGGWLHELGFRDSAGAATVHLVAGTAGFFGTYMMGPRIYRKSKKLKIEGRENLKNGYTILAEKLMNKEWDEIRLRHFLMSYEEM